MHRYDGCNAIFPAQFGIHMLIYFTVSLEVQRIYMGGKRPSYPERLVEGSL